MVTKMDIDRLLDHAEESWLIECRDVSGNADLFATNTVGDTLLHVVVGVEGLSLQERMVTIRFLVDQGLDVNARGDYMTTPLFLAAQLGNLDLVRLLLELGADSQIPDHRGEYPTGF